MLDATDPIHVAVGLAYLQQMPGDREWSFFSRP
jgi:hypothetical protein